ncbi:MAG: Zn-dependent hydrolase, partial [Ginsengibacter sp.]
MTKNISILSAFLICILSTAVCQTSLNTKIIKVDQQRIEKRIMELAQFGKDSNGNGYRVAYSKGDRDGRAYIIMLMKKAGLDVSIDYAGNIIGMRKGKSPGKNPIAFGSHIDMVPNGGNYDGCIGVISALEVIEVLNENKIITNHPLLLIIFSNEEGGEIGSHAFLGHLKKEALKEVSKSGLTIAQGIKAIGGNPDSIDEAKRKAGSITAYLEIHIEQGGILEKEKTDIGIVEGIVGIEEWEVTINGFANHAGTTPMNNRQDALLAAAKLIIAINEVINSTPGRQVGNVGKIAAEPGAPNVIPGKVVLNLELRDLSSDKIREMYKEIEMRAAGISKTSNTTISFRNLNMSSTPALMNNNIQEIIKISAKNLGL